MQILVCKSELLYQFNSIKKQMPMEDMSGEIHWREVSLKHKEEVREEAGGAFHLYCRLDSWDRRAGRKEHQLGRASDCSAVLKRVGPGCWGVLERTLLVRRVPCCARAGQHWYPLCAQSVAGSSPGEAWPCSECGGESRAVVARTPQRGLSQLCFLQPILLKEF